MSALRKRLYYVWKKLSEKQFRKTFEALYFKDDRERFEACTQRKRARQMAREKKALQKYWGCYPYQYFRHDLYRADCRLPLEEMKKYVPAFFMNRLYFPHSYKDYGVLCEDKLLTYATLKAYDVPQPKLLFCFDGTAFYNASNNPITATEADALIQQSTAAKLFVKPRFGMGGKGIVVACKDEKGQFRDEANTVLDHTFFQPANATSKKPNSICSYIVQEGLVQHPELSALYPQSVNTYRIITECKQAEVRVLYCVVRMGGGGRQIDNASAGGCFVRINLETGALYENAQAFNQYIYTAHPDTGFEFKGVTMQTWPQTKAFIVAVARKFREIRYLGWDIAVTKDGPSVIEFNNKPDMAGIQDSYGGIRDDLGINPKNWWYQSNFTIKNV